MTTYQDSDSLRLRGPSYSALSRTAPAVLVEDALAPDPAILLSAYGSLYLERKASRGHRAMSGPRSNVRNLLRALGDVAVRDLRRAHAVAVVRWATPLIASRTVHHLVSTLRGICRQAVEDGILEINPVAFRPGELPVLRDSPGFDRRNAFFADREVEILLASQRLLEQERALYALLFLAGVRFGEAAALRWKDYDETTRPLGGLWIAESWSSEREEFGPTKTTAERLMPVHPTLARALEVWRERSRVHFRVERQPEDLLFERWNQKGVLRPLDNGGELGKFHRRLASLGLRKRRLHDARKTFLTLAVAHGARREILSRGTHARPGDVLSGYIETIWESLCEEVSKLRIRGESTQLPLPLRGET